jgi:hypothetical protein
VVKNPRKAGGAGGGGGRGNGVCCVGSVTILTGRHAGRCRKRGPILITCKGISTLQLPDLMWGLPNFLSNGKGRTHSERLKRPEGEADHLRLVLMPRMHEAFLPSRRGG